MWMCTFVPVGHGIKEVGCAVSISSKQLMASYTGHATLAGQTQQGTGEPYPQHHHRDRDAGPPP